MSIYCVSLPWIGTTIVMAPDATLDDGLLHLVSEQHALGIGSVTRFGTIYHFRKKLQVFGNSWRVYFVFSKILNLVWYIFVILGKIPLL